VVAMLACLSPADGGVPVMPPTINLREADPVCDLDYTPNEAAPANVERVLVNCLAFGAKNSALAFELPRK